MSPATALAGFARVPLEDLHPSPNNPREKLTGIDELAISIREVGLVQPIIAQKIPGQPGFQIVAGHRRHAAVTKLGWSDVPTIVRRDMLPDAELLAMLVENGQRAGLDPIEEARALNWLKAGGMNIADIAVKVGRSLGYVHGRLALLALPVDEQEEVRAGVSTLREATDRAKIASGRVRPGANGRPGVGHLSTAHPLAARARARCVKLAHSRGKGKGVGGVACGECWETVIRADERECLHAQSNDRGRCVLCDTEHDPDAAA